MGGIKNRDAKKAAAKVFSSGGGGGSKGPAVVDKRGQEIKCPHCDKVYKQTSRLQDHIKKQHAPPAPAEDQNAGAVAAASTAGKPPLPSAAPAAPPKPSAPLMDVGSKGGYYSGKSPKLLLHEWCLKQKLPKPRYKAVPAAAEGRWRCRIVLPAVKTGDADAILFLLEADAAPDADEAAQRAAVLGLHKLAGDRSLDTVLPTQYRELWRAQGVRAEESRRRAAEAEARKERVASRAKAAAARGARAKQSAVVMTDQHRQHIADLLAGFRLDGNGGGGGVTGDQSTGLDKGQLSALGFAETHLNEAFAAVGPPATTGMILDWLVLNVPEEELPVRFAPGVAGKAAQVLLPGKVLGSGAASDASSGGRRSRVESYASLASSAGGAEWQEGALEDPAVRELASCGYPVEDAMRALEASGGNLLPAHQALFDRLVAGGEEGNGGAAVDTDNASSHGADSMTTVWGEECAALESIFGEEAHVGSDGQVSMSVSAAVPDGTAAADDSSGGNQQHRLEVQLRFWSRDVGSRQYPECSPYIATTSQGLDGEVLLALTRGLATQASTLQGQPMLFELVSSVGVELQRAFEAVAAQQAAAEEEAQRPALAPSLSDSKLAALESAAHDAQAASRKSRKARRKITGPSAAATAAESARLVEEAERWRTAPELESIRATRRGLPAAAKRNEVLAALARSRVLVVEGATGCGKSTQVPQFLLEDAIKAGRGGAAGLICTQPRRISATGLATRVAEERGEKVGQTVGYAVRLDSKQSERTRLLFCTTGVLLRRLLNDPSLEGTTHVILDEVHERSLESDLLLLLLKRLLVSGRNPALKVVLMSATAEADLFAGYFDRDLGKSSTARVAIPGFTHPVTEYYLEDVLEVTGFAVGKNSKWSRPDAAKLPAPTPLKGYSATTAQSLANIEDAQINYDLVVRVVEHVASKELASAPANARGVLVFATGAEEIDRLVRLLRQSPTPLHPLPLHGGLSPEQQSAVFRRGPKDLIKVVVATNVAETSITIDDVVCVVDTGRVKEMSFDPDEGLDRLRETWASQAACTQRRGRAGRVRPGTCWRLFSRQRWASLDKNTVPEIHRVSLPGFVLDLKGILGSATDVRAVAQEMLTHPRHQSLESAVGKLLIFGALLRCLDPVLTIAAAQAEGRPLFLSPPAARGEADQARRRLTAGVAASQSDHMNVIAAYNAWSASSDRTTFARDNFLSVPGMEAVRTGRLQFVRVLVSLGFVDGSYIDQMTDSRRSRRGDAGDTTIQQQQWRHPADMASASARVVKAALAAGLYPNLLRVQAPPPKYQKVHGGTVEIDADPAAFRFFDRTRGRVVLHPSSSNAGRGKFSSGWLVYSTIARTSRVFVRDTSAVSPYALLLFAGDLHVDHLAGTVTAGGWAHFACPARIAVLVRDLRAAVAATLQQRIQDPTTDRSAEDDALVRAMHSLLASDGM